MATISQKEFRNNIGAVLRRAEAGEEITITVAGRPVAQLGPTHGRQWVGGEVLRTVWRKVPKTLDTDLAEFPASLDNPFE
jgi:prevent-host-death family protein